MFASMNNCIIIVLVLPQDPSYQFKDIKQLIMGMLETYNYEEVNYASHEVRMCIINKIINVCADFTEDDQSYPDP